MNAFALQIANERAAVRKGKFSARGLVSSHPNESISTNTAMRKASCACGGGCSRCSRQPEMSAVFEKPRDNGTPGTSQIPTTVPATPMDAGTAAVATKTINIDAVKLRKSNRDPAADVNFANKVFKPANVQFNLVKNEKAADADSDVWLGGDTKIETGTCGTASQEEVNAWVGCVTNFKFNSRFRAFYAEIISSGSRADSYPEYCATGTAAALNGMATVSNTGASRSLAHELGHMLTNSADHPTDTNNLMHPTNTSTGEALTPAQRATIYANA